MQLEILSATVVVTAVQHNPSILHPSFLKAANIVDPQWEPAEPPVSTPPFSIVKYPNGIVFTVETTRLQVVDNSLGASPGKSVLPALAARYVGALPHVRHTAVGVNLKGFIEAEEPEKMLIEQFLKSGPWKEGSFTPTALGIRLVYSALGTVLRFGLDGGTIKRADQGLSQHERRGLIADANYHSDLPENSSINQVIDAIQRYPACCDHFESTVQVILGSGG